MHFKSNFYIITRMESTKIISQLLSICVFNEQRSNRNFSLTSTITFYFIFIRLLMRTRNILLTNFMSIQHSKRIAFFYFCLGIRNTIQMKEQAITLFATQTNRGYIAFIGVHITADRITSIIFLTQKIIIFRKFYRQLTISRKINTYFTSRITHIYTNSITKALTKLQPVSIWMFPQIINFTYISIIRHNFLFLSFKQLYATNNSYIYYYYHKPA